ncbi:MAG: HAD family hydrolase [Bacteroidota bacterium]
MFFSVNDTWTLFLDRDGVLNRKLENDYVKTPDELEVLPDVPEALSVLGKLFGKVIIVTNQQGIGKKLMSKDDLNRIHKSLFEELGEASDAIDEVYFCPHLAAENAACRKPQIGMAKQAQADFPEIDFSRSLMVGDSVSDMEFGRNAGMKTVFISDDNDLIRTHFDKIDFSVRDLFSVACLLRRGE